MANNEQVENLDFNELVARRGGSDRNEQESYLARVVMQLMIDYFGRGTRLPDENLLHALIAQGAVDKICEKDVFAAMEVLDAFYRMVARTLLDDSSFDPQGIRSKAMEFMQIREQSDRKIQREAGIWQEV